MRIGQRAKAVVLAIAAFSGAIFVGREATLAAGPHPDFTRIPVSPPNVPAISCAKSEAPVFAPNSDRQAFAAPKAWGGGLTSDTAWGIYRHPRMLADVNGDKRQDLIGFGDAGVYVAFSTGSKFNDAQFVLANFGYDQGWRIDKHLRTIADVNGDGNADIVAFDDNGVWTALSTGSGFSEAHLVIANFGYNQGWRNDLHVRLLGNVNGDKCADIVAFGDDGVWLALANGSGGFLAPQFVVSEFGLQRGWMPSKHLRMLADITGDGLEDIVAFGEDGIWTALSTGSSFAPPRFVLADFGYRQGWRLPQNTRQAIDADGDRKADIIGLGQLGIWYAKSTGDGGFAQQTLIPREGTDRWLSNVHTCCNPRVITDLNGDGYPDILGLREQAFSGPEFYKKPTVYSGAGTGWTSSIFLYGAGQQLYDFASSADPVLIGDVNGDGLKDLVDVNYWDATKSAVNTMVALSIRQFPPPSEPIPSDPQITLRKGTSLSLTWHDNAMGTRYFVVLYYPRHHPLPYRYVEAVQPAVTLDGLTPSTEYCFTVSAVTWFGFNGYSPNLCGYTWPY